MIARLLSGDDRDPVELFKRLSKATTDQFNQVVKDAAEIQEKLEEQITKRSGGRRGRQFREFQEDLFDISKFKLKFDKEAAKLEKRTNQELLDIQEEFAKEEADRRLKAFVEKDYDLVEAAAESVCEKLLDLLNVFKVILRVRKPHAPINADFDTIEVELIRKNEHFK